MVASRRWVELAADGGLAAGTRWFYSECIGLLLSGDGEYTEDFRCAAEELPKSGAAPKVPGREAPADRLAFSSTREERSRFQVPLGCTTEIESRSGSAGGRQGIGESDSVP